MALRESIPRFAAYGRGKRFVGVETSSAIQPRTLGSLAQTVTTGQHAPPTLHSMHSPKAPSIVPSWKQDKQVTQAQQKRIPFDGATAAAYVAYAFSEQAFIYPITPATPLGDAFSGWNAKGKKNLFGEICNVVQMQSEGGAAGALHGVVDVGTLATTFTSSQGLLLMIPNMFILAGALNPCVIHVAARAITKHALCIFGDHSDVMATRQTGFAILSAHNVQESMDMALAAHVATLKSSVPFIAFQDGFRTSHEISKPAVPSYEAMAQLVPWEELKAYRRRGLHPNHPHARQQGQFSDTFFQNAEAGNLYYEAVPQIVQATLDDIGAITGRYYKIFDYNGHPQAENVIVSMGSSCNVIDEVIRDESNKGRKIGQIKVHLYRPWDGVAFLESLPDTVKTISVLDRTKESGAREPLFLDVASTAQTAQVPVQVLGGRYGLGQKDITPGMVMSVFDNAEAATPKDNFTIGIEDDVSFSSLPAPAVEPDTCPPGTKQCLFWGMGSDGTLSANKNVIKLIGTQTEQHVQAHFVYDSKKAGGCTVSHLRFGPERIESSYDIGSADYISCSQTSWIRKFKEQMWAKIKPGGIAVLNVPQKTTAEVDAMLPAIMKRTAAERDIQLYTIDANAVAKACGLGRHTNNILSAVFFKLSEVVEVNEALDLFKASMRKSYKAKGQDIVNRNLEAVDQALSNLHRIDFPKEQWLNAVDEETDVSGRPLFCTEIMDRMSALDANDLPVSAFDPRGHFPTATTQYEKRGIALSVPVTDMDKCTQCNKCAAICPHAAIRPFLMTQVEADAAPESFSMQKAKGGVETAGFMYRMQVAPDDCTGCQACSNTCGDGALTMTPYAKVIDVENDHWDFGANLPVRGELVERSTVKGSQFQLPMLEFSGACEGCGETPYAKLVTQLFGERMLIANASGCSSVWSGTAGFSPFATNTDGQGPAYGRSLFEDAAEYGLGMAASVAQKRSQLTNRIDAFLHNEEHAVVFNMAPQRLKEAIGEWWLHKDNPDVTQKLSVTIKEELAAISEGKMQHKSSGKKSSLTSKAGSLDMFRNSLATTDASYVVLKNAPIMQDIISLQDAFVKVSCWIWGGDGWAYDIGFGGLDHVLAQSRQIDFNVLVMDTEGYSNTGGQVSKATNMGSVQKFAPAGYRNAKKDLGQIAMSYEHIYVGSIAMGADYGQSVKCLIEAEKYKGPSLVLCYSPCIEHKILFPRGLSHLEEVMKQAVEAGYWSLYRFNPALRAKGENPFTLDSKRLSRTVEEFTSTENRFMTLHRTNPELGRIMKAQLQDFVDRRHDYLKNLAAGTETATSGTPLTILVGSDTGTTIELAARTKKMAMSRDYNVTVLDLDEISSMEQLAEHSNIMVLCATAGEGDPPGNATKFFDLFEENEYPADALQGVQFHVFGLGDRGYRHFNSAAKFIDKKFEELGASRMQEVGLGDDQDDDKYETAYDEWLPDFWNIQNAPEPKDDHLIPEPQFALEKVDPTRWSYKQIMPPGTKMITLQENRRITHQEHDRIIRHLSFDIKGQDFSYLLGDALNIYPANDEKRCKAFCEWYGINPDDVYSVEPKADVDKRRKVAYQRPLPIWQMFSEVMDIFGRPNKFFYKSLAKFATDEKEKAELSLIAGDSEESKKKYVDLVTETVTFDDVLRMFPSAKPPLEQLMGMIPCIKPRLYSIASSQRAMNDKVELMIVINDWDTPSGKWQCGTSTDYIERMGQAWDKDDTAAFKMPCQITSGTFNFPESMMQPMIMAGLGTGLAPFRAFVQERAFYRRQGVETGPMWLFYGCRYRAKDYCYGEELEDYVKEGVLTELRVAFSRDQKQKIYVQHKMQDAAGELCAEFEEKNGYFYLCGQAGAVETDIENAIKQSLISGGKFTEETAAEYVEKMHEDGRYNLELY